MKTPVDIRAVTYLFKMKNLLNNYLIISNNKDILLNKNKLILIIKDFNFHSYHFG